MWEFFGVRRGVPTLVVVIGAAATLVIAWRVQRHARPLAMGETTMVTAADARRALVEATQTLAHAPGDPTAMWQRAVALQGLGLTHLAADAFEMIAAHANSRSAEARARARAIRDEERKREEKRRAVDAAGREMMRSGLVPASELVHAYPLIIERYLSRALSDARLSPQQFALLVSVAEAVDSDGKADLATQVRAAAGMGPKSKHQDVPDVSLALGLVLEQEQQALRAGDAAGVETSALRAVANARQDGLDPTDLPRRFLLLAAEAARAQHDNAVADAYVGEARLLMP